MTQPHCLFKVWLFVLEGEIFPQRSGHEGLLELVAYQHSIDLLLVEQFDANILGLVEVLFGLAGHAAGYVAVRQIVLATGIGRYDH